MAAERSEKFFTREVAHKTPWDPANGIVWRCELRFISAVANRIFAPEISARFGILRCEQYWLSREYEKATAVVRRHI